MVAGSSPLARGLRAVLTACPYGLGIIPARAGFTFVVLEPGGLRWDHPRSRGVYQRWGSAVGAGVGSSPLARGLPVGRVPDYLLAWIIPARAGFTRLFVRGCRARPDHPRSRGVYTRRSRASGSMLGSSPLARGLQHIVKSLVLVIGIIPARAGFTTDALVNRIGT